MTWWLVVAFVAGVYAGVAIMCLMAMASREDDWKDSV